jgi:hypothetical protein
MGHTGSLGFVAINNADDAWKTTFSTGLPLGLYCNVFEGPPKAGACSGSSYVQSHGFCFSRASRPIRFTTADSTSVPMAR